MTEHGLILGGWHARSIDHDHDGIIRVLQSVGIPDLDFLERLVLGVVFGIGYVICAKRRVQAFQPVRIGDGVVEFSALAAE